MVLDLELNRYSLFVVALCLPCGFLGYCLLHRSPLDAVPDAHWSVKYCSLWLCWHRYHDSDTLAVHEAHRRRGPVVRLAPNELSVCDVDTGLKPIYEGRLPKTDWYQVAVSYGAEPSFAMKDEESHRRRKRMLAKPYMNSNIRSNATWQLQQIRLSDKLRTALKSLSEKGNDVDVFDLTFAWSLASISTFVFGPKGAVDLLDDLGAASKVQAAYTEERLTAFWLAGWSNLPQKMLRCVGYSTEISHIAQMREHADTKSSLAEGNTAQANPTAYDHIKNGILGHTGSSDPASAINATDRRNALFSEIQDHIVAGVDTSQITLTICVWILSLEGNCIWQDRLRAETGQFRDKVRASDMEGLPVLDAILKETLRLYPVVAGCLPRLTDKTTVLGPAGHQVAVPPGVTVHCQAWSLHGNAAVFPEPENWNPSRWLECSSEQRRKMYAWFWAFGSGSRKCVGESLAISSMKVALATIYGGFETKATEQTRLSLNIGNLLLPIPDEQGRVLPLSIQKAPGVGR